MNLLNDVWFIENELLEGHNLRIKSKFEDTRLEDDMYDAIENIIIDIINMEDMGFLLDADKIEALLQEQIEVKDKLEDREKEFEQMKKELNEKEKEIKELERENSKLAKEVESLRER